jgi:hypothetical protein
MVIGRFGLVNFGGYTLSGLASELLDPEIDSELPARYRPLAEAIREQRARLGMENIFRGRVYVDLALFERQLSNDIFLAAVPAAKRLYGDDLLVHEPELLAFSRQVIALRKTKYLRWTAFYFPRALAKVVFFGWSLWLLLPAALVLTLLRRSRISGGPRRTDRLAHGRGDAILQSLLWLAPCYFIASVSLLCLAGSPADSRLAVPAGVFLPPLALLWCARQAQELWGRELGGGKLCHEC